MTIRNLEAFIKSLWDWNCLAGCFGEENKYFSPTDIDGIVEKKGYFLLLETKNPGKEIPDGQKIMFDRLIRRGFTIIIIWGKPGEPEKIQQWPHKPRPANLEYLRMIVSAWYDNAISGAENILK